MTIGLYLGVALGIVGFAVWIILRARRQGVNGWLIGCLAAILFSVLFMIKLRCSIGAYGCGFMSLTGGLTWHLIPGLTIFLGLWALCAALLNMLRSHGWQTWMNHLGRGMTPLLGLSIAVFWEILPVSIIHPPSVDGPCPDLPLICHDIPVMGFGGLLYWTVPFVVWAAMTVWADVSRMLAGEANPLNARQPSKGSLIP